MNQQGVSSSYGGYGSPSAQQAALRDAIISARLKNPQNYQNVPSDYLIGLYKNGTLSANDLKSVSGTLRVVNQSSADFLVNIINGGGGNPTNQPPSSLPDPLSPNQNQTPGTPNQPPGKSSLTSQLSIGLQNIISKLGPTGTILAVVGLIGFIAYKSK